MSRLSDLHLPGWWQSIPPQTRTLGILVSAAVAVVLLSVLTIGPSLKVLRFAPADHQKLDQQLDLMRNLATQAQSAKAQPKPGTDDALKFLDNSVKQTLAATAQVSVSGDRATVTLRNTSPESLTAWLTALRSTGRLLPAEAKLTRTDAGWNGQLVVNLPQK